MLNFFSWIKSVVSGIFPLSMPYRLILVALVLVAAFFAGFTKGVEHDADRHTLEEVALQKAVDDQTVHTAQVISMQNHISQEVVDEYQKRIASLNAYYSNRMLNSGNPSAVSSVPTTPSSVDATPAHPLLAECAATTEQLEALQQWVLKQQAVDH